MRWQRAIAGFVIAAGVVALLVTGVGWDEVRQNVENAHSGALAAALAAGLGMLALRGVLVGRLLSPVDGGARGVGFASAFLSGYFARSALPWGRSTGAPVTAYLLARNSDSSFEDNLAVVAVAEGFNVVASVAVAAIGFVTLAALTGHGSTDALATSVAILGGGGLVAAVVLVAVLDRDAVQAMTLDVTAGFERVGAGVFGRPRFDGLLTRRVDGFFATLAALQASHRTLVVAFAVAVVGWVFNAVPLYFSLLALGVEVPFALVLVCAPLASFGGIVPLPGGSGGIEVVLASLLVATASVSPGVATAAAILYRLTTYWTHLAIGGCAAVVLSIVGGGSLRSP